MTLGYMRPNLSLNDICNSLLRHPVFGSQFPLASIPLRVTLTDFRRLLSRQFGDAVRFAVGMPTFVVHIIHVVLLSAKKEMRGIDARCIVAAMANKQFIGDVTKVNDIGYARSVTLFASPHASPIAAVNFVRLPSPAVTGAAHDYLFPEPIRITLAILMPNKITSRLVFCPSATVIGLWSNAGFLSTTAVAITVWNVVRGIIGVHKNLQFLCQAQDAANVAGHFLLASTPVIIPQEGQL